MTQNARRNRDVFIVAKEGGTRCIPDTDIAYDALQYPLIFWQDDDGYHFDVYQYSKEKERFFNSTDRNKKQLSVYATSTHFG